MTNIAPKTLEFLSLVSSAALANPFSEARDLFDTQIVQNYLGQKANRENTAELVAREAQRVVQEIIHPLGLKKFESPPKIKQIVADAALFAVFHKFIDEFDKYIELQNSTSGKCLPLPFAEKILTDLKQLNLDFPNAHVVALFFQMRRAFFFINRYVSGQSAPVRSLRERLWRSLFTHDLRAYLKTLHRNMESFPILLLGETGVGKSQAAAALGRSAYIPFDEKSGQFEASFLDIYLSANISEYPETLVESELFGHKKGSFTGAVENYAGLLGRTHLNGVLFLDEIGELSLPVQVKLLRVLQERMYSPVGSHEQRRFSGRLVSATNANMFNRIAQGEFRADLYYRLASDIIEIPSLRERFAAAPAEKRLLTERILNRLLGETSPEQIENSLELVLKSIPENYNWPGNLREFEQRVRSFILHGPDSIAMTPLTGRPQNADHDDTLKTAWESVRWTADELLAHYARSAYAKLGSFEKVAQRLELDWRTVKKWVHVEKM